MKTSNEVTFRDRLLPMLREAVEEAGSTRNGGSTRRRPRLLVVAAVVGLGIMIAAGGIAIARRSAMAPREVVTVSGIEALRDPASVERTLRDAGIDADVVEVPLRSTASHSSEGVWWWVAFDPPPGLTGRDFARLRNQTGTGVGFFKTEDIRWTTELELPKGLPGRVTLFVGREAEPGAFTVSEYDRGNELAPTGSFYCLGLDPRNPHAVGEALTQRGYRVEWTLENLARNWGRAVDQPPAGTVVTWVWLRAPDVVDARISVDGPDARAYQQAEGTFLPGETPPWAPPCS